MVVLLEGACGAGKTTLAAALCEVARSRGLALHSVGQRHTYGLVAGLEDLGQLDDGIVRVLLGRAVAAIRERGGDQVVDTLHVTQFVRLRVLSRASFDAVDAELAEIDARIVLVRVSERALWERVIEGRRGTAFRRYAAKFGESDEALHDWLCREQEALAETARGSRLRVVEVDGEADVVEVARGVLDGFCI